MAAINGNFPSGCDDFSNEPKTQTYEPRFRDELFQRAYDHEGAYRTSNAVDRPMNDLDRTLFSMQYFHDSWAAAVQAGCAMAGLWNFHPFCRKSAQKTGHLCPFEQLNGFRYHDDWLRNFLIASSLNGRRPRP